MLICLTFHLKEFPSDFLFLAIPHGMLITITIRRTLSKFS